jgi:hypothetical protein
MRWFWRADLLTLAIDSLLEGSLVAVVYLAITPFTRPANPLPLAAFWLAAAAGLGIARLSARWWRLEDTVPVLVILTGAGALHLEKGAGFLLGVALLRGAMHVDSEHESDVSVDAVTYAFPVIAFALLMHLGSDAPFVGPVLIASLTCLVAGMFAIGRGRQREFESVGPVAHRSSFWPALGAGLTVWTVAAIPIAYVVGTVTLSVVSGPARWLAASARPLLEAAAQLFEWLVWQVGQWLPKPTMPPFPTATPGTGQSVAGSAPPAGGGGGADILLRVVIVALWVLIPVVITILCLVVVRQLFGWRRAVARARLPEPPPSASGQSPSPLARARTRLTRPRAARRRTGRRNPTSAAEAYLALLDDLEDQETLARLPTETPRDHAHRVGEQGLELFPLALLAADYQLTTYARVDVTEQETARALARWRRLRALAEERPPPE